MSPISFEVGNIYKHIKQAILRVVCFLFDSHFPSTCKLQTTNSRTIEFKNTFNVSFFVSFLRFLLSHELRMGLTIYQIQALINIHGRCDSFFPLLLSMFNL